MYVYSLEEKNYSEFSVVVTASLVVVKNHYLFVLTFPSMHLQKFYAKQVIQKFYFCKPFGSGRAFPVLCQLGW